MKTRFYVLFGVLVAVVLGTALVGAASGQSADMSDSMTTLTVVERATTDTVTDTGDEGDSVGDILTFANEVYDEANENQVGSDNGYCFRTVVGEAWECAWTLSLDDGQLMVQGPFYDASDSDLAITGGTGAYAGAHGEMHLHARNADGTEYDFIYQFGM